jgi:hypothetical protein
MKKALVAVYRLITLNFTKRLSYRRLRKHATRTGGFQGKILKKMAFDRDSRLTLFADKIRVRDFVTSRIGEQYLTKAYLTTMEGETINWSALPNEFVAKTNHSSGGNVIVWEKVPRHQSIPDDPKKHGWGTVTVHPDQLVKLDCERLMQHWLSLNYAWQFGRKYPEWAYENIVPGVLFEELLTGADGKLPEDFKFYCINGQARVVQVDSERFEGHKRSLFSTNWEPLAAKLLYPQPSRLPTPPRNLSKMVEIAETLSQGTDLLRVDLYEIGNQIVFGELTNYPEGGGYSFSPRSFDLALGAH